jgi:hypothetical protein
VENVTIWDKVVKKSIFKCGLIVKNTVSIEEIKTQFADKLESLENTSVKKTQVDSMLNEIKHAIKDNQDDSKKSAEEFIDHMTTCNDKGCSIHMMSDEFKKHGFLTGYALAKKQFERNGV